MTRTPPVPGDWVTGQSARYHYRALGPTEPDADVSGVPVVLVHGLGVSSAYFARLQPLLAMRRRVYAPDLPGFGRTLPRPRLALDTLELAGMLQDWADACGVGRMHLVGHSLGGPVTVAFARLHPERVARLIFVSSIIGRTGPQTANQSWGLLRDFLREPRDLFTVLMPDYVRAGLRRIVLTDIRADGEDTVASLAHVVAPILIIRGTRDPLVSPAAVGQLRAVAPQARYHEVPNAPHVVHWRHAEPVAAAINAFLDEDG